MSRGAFQTSGSSGAPRQFLKPRGPKFCRDIPGQRLAVTHEEHPPVALPLDEAPEEVRLAAAVRAPDREALALLDELPHLPGEDLLTRIASLAGSCHEVVGLELHAWHLRLALQAGEVHPGAGAELVEELRVLLFGPGDEAVQRKARQLHPRPALGALPGLPLGAPLTGSLPELHGQPIRFRHIPRLIHCS